MGQGTHGSGKSLELKKVIDQGNWFALHRKILDSEVFADPHMLRLWIWLLARASFKTTHVSMSTGRGSTTVTLKPGQSIVGRKSGADALEWKPSTFRNRLDRLEKMDMVSIKKDTHWSIVSIVNWRQYQATEETNRTGKGQPSRTGKGQGFDPEKDGESESPSGSSRTTKGQAKDNQRTQYKNAKNATNSSRKFEESDLEFAKAMYSKILEVAPKTKLPNFDKWANDIRLLRGDGNTLDEIKAVFAWANSDRVPSNGFCWALNIQCPAKLREKFATLHSRMPSRSSRNTSPPDAMGQVRRRKAEIEAKRKQEAFA